MWKSKPCFSYEMRKDKRYWSWQIQLEYRPIFQLENKDMEAMFEEGNVGIQATFELGNA